MESFLFNHVAVCFLALCASLLTDVVTGGCCELTDGSGFACVPNSVNCNLVLIEATISSVVEYNDAYSCQPSCPIAMCSNVHCVAASVKDDPHFFGFGGEYFEFMGEHGKYYSLFSEASTQVNARMSNATNGDPGTYLDAIAIKHSSSANTDHVLVDVGDLGTSISVSWNELKLGVEYIKDPLVLNAGGLLVMEPRERSGQKVVDSVRIELPTITLVVLKNEGHLDMFAQKVKTDLCKVHGLLGQTYHTVGDMRPAVTTNAKANKEHYKLQLKSHVDTDYLVSGPFATDDAFNLFGLENVDCTPRSPRSLRGLGNLEAEGGMVTICAGVAVGGQAAVPQLCGGEREN